MKNSDSQALQGIEGILYIIPVLGVLVLPILICAGSPVAMSYLTQCAHESISILAAAGFVGWFFWTLIRDKMNYSR